MYNVENKITQFQISHIFFYICSVSHQNLNGFFFDPIINKKINFVEQENKNEFQ